MIDLGLSKLALIGAVALIVIGPEKLPRVARTVGTMIGRAQRYVSDVKAEVNRSMELESLKQMKDSVESAARDVSQTIQAQAHEVNQTLESASADFEKDWAQATAQASEGMDESVRPTLPGPVYQRPNKNWRVKQGAVPKWFKARAGVRSKALSGAARVARYRPPRPTRA